MRIWVDCTAAAHPLVLRPVIERLRARGHEVSITAREYGQTVGILDRLGLEHRVFGRHGGGGLAGKARALAGRSAELSRWARPQRFDLALAHGSVDVAAVGSLLRIPSVQMQDYEWAGLQRKISWRVARTVIVPEAIPVERLEHAGARREKLFRYPGLKEDYYLADFEPDPAVLAELGIVRERVLVVVRPPPETSAYHARNDLYSAVIDRLAADEATTAVVIPRTEAQGEELRARREESLIVPDRAVDAQSLIAYADLVVSAGGTMNREAVALGTPVYTIFSGRMGAVDEQLIAERLLRPLADPEALELVKRSSQPGPRSPRDPEILVGAILPG
jgi:predicted glycosyltransferase